MEVGKPPIFVLGCERSGTSLLRRVLDSHSRIACPPESAFFVQLARVYEVKRALQGLLDMGFSDDDVLEQMRLFTTHFFEAYASARGKPRWADKTTQYVDHVDTIDRMFKGDVVYLFIVRHGLDVAQSLSQFDWGVLKPYLTDGTERPMAALRVWRDQNAKLLAFEETAGERAHRLTYEELTQQPEAVLRRVFDFLDEPWEPQVLEFNSIEHDKGFEDPKIENYSKIERNSGNYKRWPPDLQERAFREAGPMLARLGYLGYTEIPGRAT